MPRQWKIHDDAIMSRVGDEGVVLHLDNGLYFGLDEVATRIWELVAEGKTETSIASALCEEFDAPIESIQHDLDAFVEKLTETGLILPA